MLGTHADDGFYPAATCSRCLGLKLLDATAIPPLPASATLTRPAGGVSVTVVGGDVRVVPALSMATAVMLNDRRSPRSC
jgi:hypothetical protein